MGKNILLLRGINVGGHGKLPMVELKSILMALGAHNIETYIQSGNAVFEGPIVASEITHAIKKAKGFERRALVLKAENFKAIAAANPHQDAEGKTLHIWFAANAFEFDQTAAENLKSPNESLHFTEKAIYLHAPDGIGRSKLAAKIEKLAGVDCTARNLNTVRKLLEMIG